MANDISKVADILIAEASPVLREMATTARRITTEYQGIAAERNQKISVPIARPKTVASVTDPRNPPAPGDFEPTAVDVLLDKWEMTSFFLSDKEQMELKPGVFPAEAEEALRALINKLDQDILLTAKETFAYAAGADAAAVGWADLTKLDQVMFDNLCPLDDRSLFGNGQMKRELLNLQEFIHFDKTGETEGLRRGSLGQRLGIDIFANQNVGSHTNGTANGLYELVGIHAKGVETLTVDTGTGTILKGDIITVAGSGNHAVTSALSAGSLGIRPGLRAQCADNALVTYPSDLPASEVYAVNYCFHRRAIAFASRPLAGIASPGTEIRTVADPLSGIAVRLEVRRVGKTTQFEWDSLYGTKLVRPELVARLARRS